MIITDKFLQQFQADNPPPPHWTCTGAVFSLVERLNKKIWNFLCLLYNIIIFPNFCFPLASLDVSWRLRFPSWSPIPPHPTPSLSPPCPEFPVLAGYLASGSRSNSVQVN